MAGDKFNYSANSWWKQLTLNPGEITANDPGDLLAQILLSLSTVLSQQPGVKGSITQQQLQNNPILNTTVNSFLQNQQSSNPQGKPEAYVNWILLDEHFNLDASKSGFVQVGDNNQYLSHADVDLPVGKQTFDFIKSITDDACIVTNSLLRMIIATQ